MCSVFLLCACYNHEGNSVVAVFKEKEKALERLEIFQAYLEASPGLPRRIDDEPIEEALWEKFEDWLMNAPAGFQSNADGYFLREFELE